MSKAYEYKWREKILLRLCSHLVPKHQYSGTGTKWCCVQTLGTWYIIAQFSAWVQGLGQGHRGWILTWVLKKKGVLTLVPIKNRSQAPCLGTKSECSLIHSVKFAVLFSTLKTRLFPLPQNYHSHRREFREICIGSQMKRLAIKGDKWQRLFLFLAPN